MQSTMLFAQIALVLRLRQRQRFLCLPRVHLSLLRRAFCCFLWLELGSYCNFSCFPPPPSSSFPCLPNLFKIQCTQQSPPPPPFSLDTFFHLAVFGFVFFFLFLLSYCPLFLRLFLLLLLLFMLLLLIFSGSINSPKTIYAAHSFCMARTNYAAGLQLCSSAARACFLAPFCCTISMAISAQYDPLFLRAANVCVGDRDRGLPGQGRGQAHNRRL